MLKNYLKITLRSLLKNKTYSFLNIFGLAIGIACAALIYLWIEDEVDFDGVNVNKERIYAVRVNANFGGNTFTMWSTPCLMGPALQTEIPGVSRTARVTEDQTVVMAVGDRVVNASGKFADSSLFSMFTLPFVGGSAANVFSKPNSLVLTQNAVKKLFGEVSDAIGKVVRVDNNQNYEVTGVVKDPPENSTLQFEWLAPFDIFFRQNQNSNLWTSNTPLTYVELQPGTRPEPINAKLFNYIQGKAADAKGHAFLFPMKEWRLHDQFDNGKQTAGGRIEYVRKLSAIAWIILLVACINFMNLATASSEKRAREVGVRKVLGARKGSLAFQFISESLSMSIFAAILSIAIIAIALPSFNQLVGKHLTLGLGSPAHLVFLLIIAIICGLIAGSYPSVYLSSFNPVFVLKGLKLKAGSAALIRKGLVVLQFTISIVFIISTFIIYQQIQHVKTRNFGFNKENLVEINLSGDATKKFYPIKQDLLGAGLIADAALANHSVIYGGNNDDQFKWLGKDPNNKVSISFRKISPEFLSTTGMKLVEGHNFSEDGRLDTLDVLVTESLARLMGKGSALDKIIQYPDENDQTTLRNYRVIGVVGDYLYGDIYGKPDPVIFFSTGKGRADLIYARLKPGTDPVADLEGMEKAVRKNNPGYPFQYKFVDDQFAGMYQSEAQVGKLAGTFAMLAVIISCLGLFGLAAYTAERRTREIGIRKVLGASAASITTLLSKEFLKLIAISALVAFPVAWWGMHSWLANYSYRVTINWWIFLSAGILVALIGLFTISFQSVKAALMNPVKSLRRE